MASAWLLLLACIVGVVVLPSWWMKILSSLGVAALMSRTFVMYHDHVHGAILKSSRLAKVLFGVYGVFCLAPVTVWRRTHEYHHRHNGRISKPSIGTYPVFTKTRFEAASEAERKSYLFQRHPAVIALGYWFTFLHGMCIQPGWPAPRSTGTLGSRCFCTPVLVRDVRVCRVGGGAAGRCAAQHVGVWVWCVPLLRAAQFPVCPVR